MTFDRACPSCACSGKDATGTAGVVTCRDCGFWFADPAPGQPEIDTAAAALQRPPIPAKLIDPVLALIRPYIDGHYRIAVAGRSPGRLVAALRRYYPRVRSYEGCSAVYHIFNPDSDQFGLIILQESLEYLRDPARAFDQADATLIKSGFRDGRYLCVQVPVTAPSPPAIGAPAPAPSPQCVPPTNGAVNFFSDASFLDLARRNGYEFCGGRGSGPDAELAVLFLTYLFRKRDNAGERRRRGV